VDLGIKAAHVTASNAKNWPSERASPFTFAGVYVTLLHTALAAHCCHSISKRGHRVRRNRSIPRATTRPRNISVAFGRRFADRRCARRDDDGEQSGRTRHFRRPHAGPTGLRRPRNDCTDRPPRLFCRGNAQAACEWVADLHARRRYVRHDREHGSKRQRAQQRWSIGIQRTGRQRHSGCARDGQHGHDIRR
jgi:hypothetical protein